VADEALTVGGAARRLGIAVTTLRTWHQRYGLGPSQHLPGQHRRYTAEDFARLEMMRRLTAQGMAAAEAAGWARRLDPADKVLPPAVPLIPGTPSPGAPLPGGPSPGARLAGAPLEAARDGGGNTIAVGRAGPEARGLGRAATRLDTPAMREILENAVAQHGVVRTWDSIVVPVLVGIGERHAAAGRLVEVEHLLSRCVTEVLGAVPRPPGDRLPRILLSCADEEQHSLPMEALAAALAEHGVPSRLLGARVPPEALADTIVRTGPTAVVVWSHAPATGDPTQLTRLLGGRQGPLLVAAAGPGWQEAEMPPQIPVVRSLAEAVRITLAVARPADERA